MRRADIIYVLTYGKIPCYGKMSLGVILFAANEWVPGVWASMEGYDIIMCGKMYTIITVHFEKRMLYTDGYNDFNEGTVYIK